MYGYIYIIYIYIFILCIIMYYYKLQPMQQEIEGCWVLSLEMVVERKVNAKPWGHGGVRIWGPSNHRSHVGY
jgi:hypothetical protein